MKLAFRLGLGLVVGLPLADVGLASIQAVDEVGRLGNAKPRFRFAQPAVKLDIHAHNISTYMQKDQ